MSAFGKFFHRLIGFISNLVGAVRHVRSGGQTTRTRARTRAVRPPRRCGECGQHVAHSPDWRDHLADECRGGGAA